MLHNKRMFQIRKTGPVHDRSRFCLKHNLYKHFINAVVRNIITHLNFSTMKRYIPLPFIAIVLILNIAACNGSISGNAGDSTRIDTTPVTKIDSTLNPDTSKKDSLKMTSDIAKKIDTTAKSTEVKKTSSKKN